MQSTHWQDPTYFVQFPSLLAKLLLLQVCFVILPFDFSRLYIVFLVSWQKMKSTIQAWIPCDRFWSRLQVQILLPRWNTDLLLHSRQISRFEALVLCFAFLFLFLYAQASLRRCSAQHNEACWFVDARASLQLMFFVHLFAVFPKFPSKPFYHYHARICETELYSIT